MNRAILILCHVLTYGFIAFFLQQDTEIRWLTACLAAPVFIWISTVDFERYEIPDGATLLLLFIGLVGVFYIPGVAVADRVLGAVLWPAIFWFVAEFYVRLRGQYGLGFGDVKLMAAIGIWVGFTGTIFVILAASLGGILALAVVAVMKRVPLDDLGGSAIAFGPFLCISTWAIWLSGGQ